MHFAREHVAVERARLCGTKIIERLPRRVEESDEDRPPRGPGVDREPAARDDERPGHEPALVVAWGQAQVAVPLHPGETNLPLCCRLHLVATGVAAVVKEHLVAHR